MNDNKSNIKDNKTKELIAKLESGIQDLYSSEKYINYLKTMSKFHNYSINNSLLIAIQNPYATNVAGFNTWKNTFKRTVNNGEKGIKILAPTPYRIKLEKQKIDPETHKPMTDKSGNPITETVEVIKPCFKVVNIFDVSQTSGEPLPTIANELKADVENFENFYSILKTVSPFPINEKVITSGANGYCDPVNKEIAIRTGMSEAQTIKTCIHEIAHSILHANYEEMDKDSHTMEVEAESVAFVVSNHFGIETSDYSFGYIAGWSSDKELKELKSSLDTIQKTANKLITDIETAYKELQLSNQNILDSIIHDNEIDLNREKTYSQEKSYNHVLKGNSDYYKMFYAGSGGQDNEAIEYQKKTGWNRIWGSDNDGLNGNTWIVYRSVSDLPKWLHDFANYQEKQGLNVTVNGENSKKSTMVERIAAAKERSTQNPRNTPIKNRIIDAKEKVKDQLTNNMKEVFAERSR